MLYVSGAASDALEVGLPCPERHRTNNPGQSGLRPGLAVTTNQLFVIALITLVANDHFLKASFGNTLTGKLSDVAELAVLAMVTTAIAAGLAKTRPGEAVAVGCVSAFTLLCLYGGYYETYVVFPLASVAAVFFLVVTTITTIGLSQTSKLGPSPTVGFVAALPSIGTMISSVPVVVWSKFNVATFEAAAILQLVLVVVMSIGLFFWSHLTTRTVALSSSVAPNPRPARP